jgi:acyl carrier protein
MGTAGSRYVDEIKRIVCETFEIDPGTVNEDTPFAEMGVDSRRRVRLLATVEVHFGIDIDLDELDRLTDIRNAAEVLAETLDREPDPRSGG